MKYRFTPLHLPAIYFFCDGLFIVYQDSQRENTNGLGLGGLSPFISIGLALFILLVDLTIQFAVFKTAKHDHRKMIYWIEFAILILMFLWVWKTFYPDIQRH
jgi:hypothetical protein